MEQLKAQTIFTTKSGSLIEEIENFQNISKEIREKEDNLRYLKNEKAEIHEKLVRKLAKDSEGIRYLKIDMSRWNRTNNKLLK